MLSSAPTIRDAKYSKLSFSELEIHPYFRTYDDTHDDYRGKAVEDITTAQSTKIKVFQNPYYGVEEDDSTCPIGFRYASRDAKAEKIFDQEAVPSSSLVCYGEKSGNLILYYKKCIEVSVIFPVGYLGINWVHNFYISDLPTEDDLFQLMKSSNIDDLYNKFNENGVTSETLWTLTDEILTDRLQLSHLQKLRYNDSRIKQHKSKI